eukprot:GFUD01019564.1.p1 GENE.GFUD01019564.1~~GFUD01019564.1.p1  ORF type:complete len:410 (-),score=104.21 GFUD01019564.1:131-1360(-)
MFEKLGEIYANKEKFASEAEEPPVFLWFPRKSDYEYIPPALLNESADHKIDRVIKLAKSARSDLNQICSGDLEIEVQIIRFFELKDNLQDYKKILKSCEEHPDSKEDLIKEKVAKAKHILDEVVSAVADTKTESFTANIRIESEFKIGLQKNLIPWIDDLENQSLKQLEKPENFEHAREIERNTVVFAKEARKANKLLTNLEGSIDSLPDKKLFATQQIQDQKQRFRNIATIAATRVETMRDLLINWNFFIETKGEADRLSETTQKMFEMEPLSDEFKIDENDFVHGLPKVLLGWIHLAEAVLNKPPKPVDLEKSLEIFDLFKKFCAVVELANKTLERIEECTEKTPSHQEVWDQRCKMKKILQKSKGHTGKLELLSSRWKSLIASESSDNIDFQPLLQFLNVYNECYA